MAFFYPTDKYNDFIDANRVEDAEDRLKTMKKLVCIKCQQMSDERDCDDLPWRDVHSFCVARSTTSQITITTP